MKQKSWILAYLLWSACGNAQAQANQVSQTAVLAQSRMAVPQREAGDNDAGTLDAKREKHAAQVFLTLVEKVIVAAADAMPANKYGFAPTDGEFKGVRTFGQMVKHLSTTNHILAAAALAEEPPADAGDEVGPETVRTKAEVVDYLKQSFAHLDKAVAAIGEKNATVKSSPISPLKGAEVTRLSLVNGIVDSRF